MVTLSSTLSLVAGMAPSGCSSVVELAVSTSPRSWAQVERLLGCLVSTPRAGSYEP
jgi:hypothetical protein